MVRKDAGRIFIVVADTGRDIRKEESEIIFEPFVSSDASRKGNIGVKHIALVCLALYLGIHLFSNQP